MRRIKINNDITVKWTITTNGAGGKLETYICNTFATLGGKTFSQFLIADIDNIIASIRHETGVEIAGIISLPQMRFYGVEIDTDDNFIRI